MRRAAMQFVIIRSLAAVGFSTGVRAWLRGLRMEDSQRWNRAHAFAAPSTT